MDLYQEYDDVWTMAIVRKVLSVAISITAVVGLMACDREPRHIVAPTPIDLSGQWTGAFYLASCSQYHNCGFFTSPTIPTAPFTLKLSLSQDGAALTGTLEPMTWAWVPTPLTGTIRDGVVHLSGHSEWTGMGFCRHSGTFDLHNLEARVDAGTRRLTGQLSFNGFKTLSSCYAAQIEVVGRDLQLAAAE